MKLQMKDLNNKRTYFIVQMIAIEVSDFLHHPWPTHLSFGLGLIWFLLNSRLTFN